MMHIDKNQIEAFLCTFSNETFLQVVIYLCGKLIVVIIIIIIISAEVKSRVKKKKMLNINAFTLSGDKWITKKARCISTLEK